MPMSPSELRDAGIRLYGGYGWQSKLARDLMIDGSTVRRWVSGAVPVSGPAEAAIRCWLREKDRTDPPTSATTQSAPGRIANDRDEAP